MNSTYYFGVMVRLFAIALFVYGVSRLEYVINFSSYSDSYVDQSIIFSIVSSVLPMVISIIIWFFPLLVAQKILPSSDDSKVEIDAHSLLTVFVLAIGLYAIYYAIADSLYWLTLANVFVRDEFGGISKTFSNQDKSSIVATVIQFLLAVFLLARAKTIATQLFSFAR